jgi:hypothetical protein
MVTDMHRSRRPPAAAPAAGPARASGAAAACCQAADAAACRPLAQPATERQRHSSAGRPASHSQLLPAQLRSGLTGVAGVAQAGGCAGWAANRVITHDLKAVPPYTIFTGGFQLSEQAPCILYMLPSLYAMRPTGTIQQHKGSL